MSIAIPAKDQFQPGDDAIKMWLGTRKAMLQIAGMAAPGLLSDVGNSVDTRWVVLATLLEAVGLGAMIWGGIENGGSYITVATLGAIALAVLDYVFAMSLHSREPVRCLCRAMLPYFANNAMHRVTLEGEIEKGKWTRLLFRLLIGLIAVIKLGGVFLLGAFSGPLIYAVFGAFYAIVAYVHINHTGYWWSYFSADSMIRKQYKSMNTSPTYKAQPWAEHVRTPEPLNLPITTLIHYSVTSLPNGTYRIEGQGVLSDRDIDELSHKQTPQNKIALFRACRRLQFSLIHMNEMPAIPFPDETGASSSAAAAAGQP